MKKKIEFIISFLFLIYLLIVLFTNYSFTGFWVDLIITVCFSVFAIKSVFKNKSLFIKVINSLSILIILFIISKIINTPSSLDKLKNRSFSFQRIDDRIFHGYFKPVGSYSGGQGSVWITESPKYFPLIEKQIYWKRVVLHDFKEDFFEGKAVDNDALMKEFIKEEIVQKKIYK